MCQLFQNSIGIVFVKVPFPHSNLLEALLARVKDHGKTAGCNKAWNGITNERRKSMDT